MNFLKYKFYPINCWGEIVPWPIIFFIAKTAKQSNSESKTVIIIDYLPGLGFLASSVPLPYQ